jgi:hypothetical protein
MLCYICYVTYIILRMLCYVYFVAYVMLHMFCTHVMFCYVCYVTYVLHSIHGIVLQIQSDANCQFGSQFQNSCLHTVVQLLDCHVVDAYVYIACNMDQHLHF